MKELNRDQLLEIAQSQHAEQSCPACSTLTCPGWVSVPGYFDLGNMQVLGKLKPEGADEYAEPTWEEYHPNGTNLWSEDAPVSIDHHPYNRSDVRECISCKRKFLHYTEYGGYYLDERIRELNAALIV